MNTDEMTPSMALAECRRELSADQLRLMDAQVDRLIAPYKATEIGKGFLNYLFLRLAAHCERDEI